jgi:hypothetical protein
MLDYGDDSGCHESRRPNGLPGAGHLDDLDGPSGCRHLNSATSACGGDVEPLDAPADIDQDLDMVALHLS